MRTLSLSTATSPVLRPESVPEAAAHRSSEIPVASSPLVLSHFAGAAALEFLPRFPLASSWSFFGSRFGHYPLPPAASFCWLPEAAFCSSWNIPRIPEVVSILLIALITCCIITVLYVPSLNISTRRAQSLNTMCMQMSLSASDCSFKLRTHLCNYFLHGYFIPNTVQNWAPGLPPTRLLTNLPIPTSSCPSCGCSLAQILHPISQLPSRPFLIPPVAIALEIYLLPRFLQ